MLVVTIFEKLVLVFNFMGSKPGIWAVLNHCLQGAEFAADSWLDAVMLMSTHGCAAKYQEYFSEISLLALNGNATPIQNIAN